MKTVINTIGRVSIEPEVVGEKTKIVVFSLATDLKKDETIFFNCCIFGDRIEEFSRMLEFFKKGSLISVTGTLNNVKAYMSKKTNEPKAQVSICVKHMDFINTGKKKED